MAKWNEYQSLVISELQRISHDLKAISAKVEEVKAELYEHREQTQRELMHYLEQNRARISEITAELERAKARWTAVASAISAAISTLIHAVLHLAK